MKKTENQHVYIGLDIGKTKVATGIVSTQGEILFRSQVPTEIQKGGKAIVDQCRHQIELMLSNRAVRPKGIGIGSTGVVDHKQGVIVSSGSIPGWLNIRIGDLFEQEFGLPVAVENDVIASALGEHFFGAGRGANTSVFLVISTGVGFGVIQNGKAWRGSHSLAGQIAHLQMFGKERTVNEMFSGRGISKRGSELLGRHVSTDDVFSLASKGNAKAKKVIEGAVESAALTIAWIQNTIDPDILIIGGGVALNEKEFVDEVRLKAERFLAKYRAKLKKLNVAFPKLGSDAGLIGTVALFSDGAVPSS